VSNVMRGMCGDRCWDNAKVNKVIRGTCAEDGGRGRREYALEGTGEVCGKRQRGKLE